MFNTDHHQSLLNEHKLIWNKKRDLSFGGTFNDLIMSLLKSQNFQDQCFCSGEELLGFKLTFQSCIVKNSVKKIYLF